MKFTTYKYTPKKEIKNAAVFSGICLFAAASLIIVSSFISNFRIIYQLSGIIFATAGIQLTTRFILSNYVYVLDKTDFIILKINGSKSTQICNVALETAIGISIQEKKFAEIEKNFGKVNIRMNFCQNMFSVKPYVYIFEFNQKKAAVTFDADENFITEMRLRIDYAKSQTDSDEY